MNWVWKIQIHILYFKGFCLRCFQFIMYTKHAPLHKAEYEKNFTLLIAAALGSLCPGWWVSPECIGLR